MISHGVKRLANMATSISRILNHKRIKNMSMIDRFVNEINLFLTIISKFENRYNRANEVILRDIFNPQADLKFRCYFELKRIQTIPHLLTNLKYLKIGCQHFFLYIFELLKVQTKKNQLQSSLIKYSLKTNFS